MSAAVQVLAVTALTVLAASALVAGSVWAIRTQLRKKRLRAFAEMVRSELLALAGEGQD